MDATISNSGTAFAPSEWTSATMETRIVRYGDLRPCFNAFIDCRSPGSETKENFTIIGPGVSENPAQHVHIEEPHGFNIGAARQPPGCINSQHSHESAEVFVVHSGRWRFDLGEHGQDAQVELAPGDVISLPVHTFRGFTNVGAEIGFLWAVLGKDDPGRVTWAPPVFEMASDFGLVLLENGRLVDTAAGESVPEQARPMPPTSPAQAARLNRVGPAEAQQMVVRNAQRATDAPITPIIGSAAPLAWEHGFTLDRIDLADGARTDSTNSPTADVLFVHRGALAVVGDGGEVMLNQGDTMTVPPHLPHTLRAHGTTTAFVVRAAR